MYTSQGGGPENPAAAQQLRLNLVLDLEYLPAQGSGVGLPVHTGSLQRFGAGPSKQRFDVSRTFCSRFRVSNRVLVPKCHGIYFQRLLQVKSDLGTWTL